MFINNFFVFNFCDEMEILIIIKLLKDYIYLIKKKTTTIINVFVILHLKNQKYLKHRIFETWSIKKMNDVLQLKYRKERESRIED